MRRVMRTIASSVSLFLAFAVIGAGVGLFLGDVTGRKFSYSGQSAFAEGSAYVGAAAACLVGPFLYFIVLEQQASFGEFATVVAVGMCAGCLPALGGSEVLTPIVAVIGAFAAAILIKQRRYNQTRRS